MTTNHGAASPAPGGGPNGTGEPRTPAWLPILGIVLLVALAIWLLVSRNARPGVDATIEVPARRAASASDAARPEPAKEPALHLTYEPGSGPE